MIMKIEAILQHLTTMVTALPVFAAWTISRDEYQETPVAQLPVAFLYPTKDVKESLEEDWDNYVENRILTVAMAFRTTTFPVSTTTIPLLDAVCNAIKADKTLGGLALQVRIHTLSWDGSNSGDGQVATAALVAEVIYRTEP